VANLEFAGRVFPVQPGESVLDCLLRHGEQVSHSCKSGVCQSCLVKGSGGTIPERAQSGLKDTLRAQGYFLACSCYPEGDLTVAPAGNDQRVEACITGLDRLSETVMRVRLRPANALDYRPGQYVSMFREDGLARSYSLASLPEEGELELHVRRIPGGAMSQWLHHEASSETRVWLQGPSGNCFYAGGNSEQPLLLAGTGTGLAPLYGIVRDALARQHAGPVWLFHGAVETAGLYLMQELRSLTQRFANFHYVPSVLRGEAPAGGDTGTLESCVLSLFPKLQGWRGYVCGDPAFVNAFRKKIFLAGIASKDIHADAFIPSAA
jgi:CDP-4-dehydro-6-deoxyglucose reductase